MPFVARLIPEAIRRRRKTGVLQRKDASYRGRKRKASDRLSCGMNGLVTCIELELINVAGQYRLHQGFVAVKLIMLVERMGIPVVIVVFAFVSHPPPRVAIYDIMCS